MQTVVTETIGGYRVIVSFDSPTIDPFGTARENKLTYYTPKPGEYMISESEYRRLRSIVEAAKPGELVTKDGDVISIVDTMTPQEIEAARVATLDKVLEVAARERAKLEILGDLEALEKSRDWYKERVAEVEAFYGGERGAENV